jgi:hypothetical protein
MYTCAMCSEFSVSTIFLLDLGNVPTVWYIFCHFIFCFKLSVLLTVLAQCVICLHRIHVDEEVKLYNLV